ncbi:MAG: winged helix-turn-helix transcriptional regulator [Candidatus Thermoplasmatota archaeon]
MTEKKKWTMPPDNVCLLHTWNRFGFLLVAAAFLLGFCADVVVVSSAQTDVFIATDALQLSSLLVKTDYAEIVSDPGLNTSTIILNGALKNLVQLPEESQVVLLPNDRLAIKSYDETSLLPEGSTVVFYDEKPLVRIPQESEVLAVSTVVESPLQEFTTNTKFIQSIQELDVYQVQIVFFELAKEHLDVPLASYTIDWGDGSSETYMGETITVSHVYQRSGTYRLLLNVSDALGFSYMTTQWLTVDYEGHLTHSSLWVNKNKGPLTALTATFSVLAVGLAVFTETGRYRLLMLFTLLMPFYSRISKEDVLDQFVRGQIYGYIKTNPGVHYNQILREVGVKNGTLSYHLGVLEKTELIQSRREGLKYRVFYPTGMSFPKSERFRLTALQIQILNALKRQPGITQKELAILLDQKPQTINYNMKVLDQANLVSVVRKGRRTTCFAVEQPATMAD